MYINNILICIYIYIQMSLLGTSPGTLEGYFYYFDFLGGRVPPRNFVFFERGKGPPKKTYYETCLYLFCLCLFVCAFLYFVCLFLVVFSTT